MSGKTIENLHATLRFSSASPGARKIFFYVSETNLKVAAQCFSAKRAQSLSFSFFVNSRLSEGVWLAYLDSAISHSCSAVSF